MTDHGITGYGAYVPRLRLERGAIAAAHRWMAPSLKGLARGERAFCSWDEDSITMAVEAARDCLGSAPRDGIAALTLASTTLPYASLLNSGIAAGALALAPSARLVDMGGSPRAGVTGLAQALDQPGEALLIAADRLRARPASTQEMAYGAGAAALRLGSEGVIARRLGAGSVSAAFIDHFRATDVSHDYFWEERWIRDEGYAKLISPAIEAALAEAALTIADVHWFVMASPLRGAASAVAARVKFAGKIADGLEGEVGYAGAAHPLLMLAGVLEKAAPGERILLIGFGQGAEALLLETTPALETFRPARGLGQVIADKVVTADYLRMLSFYDEIELEWGMRAEKSGKAALTTLYREADQLSAFVAGRCQACGTAQFPQLAYCVNPACQAPSAQFDALPLTEEPARVLTYTNDWLSYYPAPPMIVGFVQFDVGARLLMETVDFGPEGVDVGTPLRMVFRVKEPDKARSFNRYFWKATPIAKGA
jgi:3-hydroxy-3-methylglutaryl CoA synthase